MHRVCLTLQLEPLAGWRAEEVRSWVRGREEKQCVCVWRERERRGEKRRERREECRLRSIHSLSTPDRHLRSGSPPPHHPSTALQFSFLRASVGGCRMNLIWDVLPSRQRCHSLKQQHCAEALLAGVRIMMEYWKQCALWLINCKVLPANHRVTWDSAQVFDLAQTLRDGVLLCHLLNNLRAQTINLKEINLRPQMSQVRSETSPLYVPNPSAPLPERAQTDPGWIIVVYRSSQVLPWTRNWGDAI